MLTNEKKPSPSPPTSPQGVNIMMFCKEYNARTQDQAGMIIPVEITVFEVRDRVLAAACTPVTHALGNYHPRGTWLCTFFFFLRVVAFLSLTHLSRPQLSLFLQDKSFTFILKTPPASVLLKKAAGVDKGAANPATEVVGSVTRDQLEVRRRPIHCPILLPHFTS